MPGTRFTIVIHDASSESRSRGFVQGLTSPFLAKAVACSAVCRLSFGRAIHSRMIFRRVSWSSMLAVPWLSVDSRRLLAISRAALLSRTQTESQWRDCYVIAGRNLSAQLCPLMP